MPHSIYTFRNLLLTFFIWFISTFQLSAQFSDRYEPKLTRILILLDGSGSMKEKWEGESKFDLSKKLIVHFIDSLQRTNPKVEFAIRVFGHQYPRSQRNCTDSKLEVDFGTYSISEIQQKLNKITPQGWTPITYSLKLAAKDFSPDPNAKNAIVLITDGVETCGGDPCEAGADLQNRRISLKPFIIGLGLGLEKKSYFDCVGQYYNVSTSATFKKVFNTVITQSLNPTTAQINLLNEFGKPTETDIAITMYDSYTGKVLYNFIHTLDDNGLPDTLKLNPSGKYDIEVHSIPPVFKKDVELTPGRHNIIAIDVPQGSLKLIDGDNYFKTSLLQGIIRKKDDHQTLFVQDLNTTRKYITGTYDLEILTLPRVHIPNIEIGQSQVTEINVESAGRLSITSSHNGIASIYVTDNGELVRIYQINNLLGKQVINLQPGKYTLITRMDKNKNSNFTSVDEFEISAGKITSLMF